MFTAKEVLALILMSMLSFYGAIIATRGLDTFGTGYLWLTMLWTSGLIVGLIVGYICNNWSDDHA
jgi:formate-dependent nitrite reductase membrane component NrfD